MDGPSPGQKGGDLGYSCWQGTVDSIRGFSVKPAHNVKCPSEPRERALSGGDRLLLEATLI